MPVKHTRKFSAGNMEQLNFYLYFCFVLLRPVSLHPAEEHLVMSDLTPYNSLHGPEQIHIAYGDSPSEMTILWSTSNSTELASSIVLYGLAPKNYSSKAEGKFVLFTEGNPEGLKYIHRVVLQVRGLTSMENYKINAFRIRRLCNLTGAVQDQNTANTSGVVDDFDTLKICFHLLI